MLWLWDVFDRIVYLNLGEDALAFVGVHPWVRSVVLFGLLGVGGALLVWAFRRIGRWQQDLRIGWALAWSADGRRCLASARSIRRGAVRLREALRREIQDRAERRGLLKHLDRFTRSELRQVLEQALHLIRSADDRREQRLRGELAWQTEAWNGSPDDKERGRLQQAIARTRQQLALLAPANAARTQHVRALGEAAEAVRTLEQELSALGQARERTLPAFRTQLVDTARRISALREAYRELEGPP